MIKKVSRQVSCNFTGYVNGSISLDDIQYNIIYKQVGYN
jgi:hypothetical protein